MTVQLWYHVSMWLSGIWQRWIVIWASHAIKPLNQSCNDFFGNNAQKEGDRRKRTSDLARTRTYTLLQSLSHELSVPVANSSSLPSPYVPVIGVPLYSEHLGPTPRSWYSDGNGLSGRPACSGDPRSCGGWVSFLCLASMCDIIVTWLDSCHQLYSKPTHTNRYLDFQSHHPVAHKITVVKTLNLRAKNLPSMESCPGPEVERLSPEVKRTAAPPSSS